MSIDLVKDLVVWLCVHNMLCVLAMMIFFFHSPKWIPKKHVGIAREVLILYTLVASIVLVGSSFTLLYLEGSLQ